MEDDYEILKKEVKEYAQVDDTGLVVNILVVDDSFDFSSFEEENNCKLVELVSVDIYSEEEKELYKLVKEVTPDFEIQLTKKVYPTINDTKWSEELGFYEDE